MQASNQHPKADKSERPPEPQAAQARSLTVDEGLDLSLLEDSLAKTPWERMQANDDALRFAETLQTAMMRLDAKSQRTDAETR